MKMTVCKLKWILESWEKYFTTSTTAELCDLEFQDKEKKKKSK